MRIIFLRLLSAGLLISALFHLLVPAWTERLMSQPRHVRCVGAVLLAMMVQSVSLGLYLLALLLTIFGLPRVVSPEGSIRLQQRLYPRRVHGVLLLAAAASLWLISLQR